MKEPELQDPFTDSIAQRGPSMGAWDTFSLDNIWAQDAEEMPNSPLV